MLRGMAQAQEVANLVCHGLTQCLVVRAEVCGAEDQSRTTRAVHACHAWNPGGDPQQARGIGDVEVLNQEDIYRQLIIEAIAWAGARGDEVEDVVQVAHDLVIFGDAVRGRVIVAHARGDAHLAVDGFDDVDHRLHILVIFGAVGRDARDANEVEVHIQRCARCHLRHHIITHFGCAGVDGEAVLSATKGIFKGAAVAGREEQRRHVAQDRLVDVEEGVVVGDIDGAVVGFGQDAGFDARVTFGKRRNKEASRTLRDLEGEGLAGAALDLDLASHLLFGGDGGFGDGVTVFAAIFGGFACVAVAAVAVRVAGRATRGGSVEADADGLAIACGVVFTIARGAVSAWVTLATFCALDLADTGAALAVDVRQARLAIIHPVGVACSGVFVPFFQTDVGALVGLATVTKAAVLVRFAAIHTGKCLVLIGHPVGVEWDAGVVVRAIRCAGATQNTTIPPKEGL